MTIRQRIFSDPFLRKLPQDEFQEISNIFQSWGLSQESFYLDLDGWFGNFNSSDKKLALKLVKHIDFYNYEKFSRTIKSIKSKIQRHLIEIEREHYPVLLITPKGEGDSAHRHAYDLAKIWNIQTNTIIDVVAALEMNPMNRVMVFFNDTHGSGNQFLNDFNEELRQFYKQQNVIIIAAITISGMALSKFRKEVPYAFIIPDEPAASVHDYFTKEEFTRIKNIGRKIYPKHPIGYGNTALLCAYYYQCPNNTLPIIWADGINNMVGGKAYPWAPLFPYRPKIKTKGINRVHFFSPIHDSSNCIPRAPFGFVHRKKMEELLELSMKPGQPSLLVISGPPGTGKTVLTANFARKYFNVFATLFWIDIRSKSGNSQDIIETLLESILGKHYQCRNFQFDSNRLYDQLTEIAKTKKKILVIFDNCEKVDDNFEELCDIISKAPHCHLIITTRLAGLSLRNTFSHIEVDVFEPAEAVEHLASWFDKSDPRFSQSNLLAIAKHELFIPSWLVLAGSYLHRSGESVKSYLAGPGVFYQIYKKLSKPEQYLMLACCVCSSTGFYSEIPEKLLWNKTKWWTNIYIRMAIYPRIRSFRGLIFSKRKVDCSTLLYWGLLKKIPGGKYYVSPAIRLFVSNFEDSKKMIELHTDFILSAIRKKRKALILPDIRYYFEELIQCLKNLEAVNEPLMHAYMCIYLENYWIDSPSLPFAESALGKAVSTLINAGFTEAVPKLLSSRAAILTRMGQWDKALSLYDSVKSYASIYENSLHLKIYVEALAASGFILKERSRLPEAKQKLHEASLLLEKFGRAEEQTLELLIYIGSLYTREKEFTEAYRTFQLSLDLSEKLRSHYFKASTYHHIGLYFSEMKNYDMGLSYLEKAILIYRSLNRKDGLQASLCLKGSCYAAKNEILSSKSCYKEGLENSIDVGDRNWEAENRLGLGMVYIAEKKFGNATRDLNKAIQLFDTLIGKETETNLCRQLLLIAKKKLPIKLCDLVK